MNLAEFREGQRSQRQRRLRCVERLATGTVENRNDSSSDDDQPVRTFDGSEGSPFVS